MVRREVARVQRIVEGQHADLRRRLLATSRVLERQRSVLQEWRQEILEGRSEGLLAAASPRWRQLLGTHDEAVLRGIERRITLITADRCWSQHLTDMQALRDEVHLVQLDGRILSPSSAGRPEPRSKPSRHGSKRASSRLSRG